MNIQPPNLVWMLFKRNKIFSLKELRSVRGIPKILIGSFKFYVNKPRRFGQIWISRKSNFKIRIMQFYKMKIFWPLGKPFWIQFDEILIFGPNFVLNG